MVSLSGCLYHTLGNIVAGNSWWAQCCAQIHQQLCCPFTDNNDVSYFTWSSKNVTQLVAYLCKIAYPYACSFKRKRVAFASAVIIAIVLHTKVAKKAMQSTCVEQTVDP